MTEFERYVMQPGIYTINDGRNTQKAIDKYAAAHGFRIRDGIRVLYDVRGCDNSKYPYANNHMTQIYRVSGLGNSASRSGD